MKVVNSGVLQASRLNESLENPSENKWTRAQSRFDRRKGYFHEGILDREASKRMTMVNVSSSMMVTHYGTCGRRWQYDHVFKDPYLKNKIQNKVWVPKNRKVSNSNGRVARFYRKV
ncbi:hypothetical protein AMTRI_Chr10g3730 [Amborella trichopoda]